MMQIGGRQTMAKVYARKTANTLSRETATGI